MLRAQKQLFTLTPKHHDRGSVIFAWHPEGNFLATCGQNRIVTIFNRQGEEFAKIPLEGTGFEFRPRLIPSLAACAYWD